MVGRGNDILSCPTVGNMVGIVPFSVVAVGICVESCPVVVDNLVDGCPFSWVVLGILVESSPFKSEVDDMVCILILSVLSGGIMPLCPLVCPLPEMQTKLS